MSRPSIPRWGIELTAAITYQPPARAAFRCLFGAHNPPPWPEGWWCGLGRAAVYSAFRGLRPGENVTAWVPAFHCGIEVQAVLDAGYRVEYYGIREDLSVDEDDLRQGIEARPGPVLVTHFFGHPQPGIERIAIECRERGVPLVEDCCHAWLSRKDGRLLGSVGGLAAFSPRKTLGTPDGGYLALSREHLPTPLRTTFAAPVASRRSVWPYRWLARGPWLRARRLFVGLGGRPDENLWGESRVDELEGGADWGYRDRASQLAVCAGTRSDPERIVRRRRRNWEVLARLLVGAAGVDPLHRSLEPGACPLGFVVSVAHRPSFIHRLHELGIEPYVFGEQPHPSLDRRRFTGVLRLRDCLVCLPIHHKLGLDEVQQVADAVLSAAGAAG